MDNKGDVKKYTNQYLMVGKIAVGGDKLLSICFGIYIKRI